MTFTLKCLTLFNQIQYIIKSFLTEHLPLTQSCFLIVRVEVYGPQTLSLATAAEVEFAFYRLELDLRSLYPSL